MSGLTSAATRLLERRDGGAHAKRRGGQQAGRGQYAARVVGEFPRAAFVEPFQRVVFVAGFVDAGQFAALKFLEKTGRRFFLTLKLATSPGERQRMPAQRRHHAAQYALRHATAGELAQEREGVGRGELGVEPEGMRPGGLGLVAGEHEPRDGAVEDGEQVGQVPAIAGFLGAFHHDEGLASGAGTRGADAGGLVGGLRRIEAVRERVPGLLGELVPRALAVIAEPVEVKQHDAARERAACEVVAGLQKQSVDGFGSEGGLAETSGSPNAGVFALAQAAEKVVELGVASEELAGTGPRRAVTGQAD